MKKVPLVGEFTHAATHAATHPVSSLAYAAGIVRGSRSFQGERRLVDHHVFLIDPRSDLDRVSGTGGVHRALDGREGLAGTHPRPPAERAVGG